LHMGYLLGVEALGLSRLCVVGEGGVSHRIFFLQNEHKLTI